MNISVVIPNYNQSRYIERCLLSTWWQLQPNDDIILIDDASTDNTYQVRCLIKTLQSGPSPKQLKYIQHDKNLGVSISRNECATIAKGDWIIFLDGDDLLAPFGLSIFRNEIARCSSDTQVITGTKIHEINETNFFLTGGTVKNIMQQIPFLLCQSIIRKSAFEAVGGFNPNIHVEEDWDLFLRIHKQFGPNAFKSIEGLVSYYHVNTEEREHKRNNRNYLVDGINVREYFRQQYGCTNKNDSPDP